MKTRREYLIAGLAALGGVSLPACDRAESKIVNIGLRGMSVTPSQEEFNLILNVVKRREKLKEKPLIIRGRLFDSDVRMTSFTLENTDFIDCDFLSSVMLNGTMNNVRFTNCLFEANTWDDGYWENVVFTDCAFRGPFNIGPKRGEKVLRFDGCEFQGATAETLGYGGRSEYFGSIGGTDGDVVFTKCDFERVYINGGSTLTLRDCMMDETVILANDNCAVIWDRVKSQGVIDVGAGTGKFASFDVKQSDFAGPLTFKGAQVGAMNFEDVKVDLALNILRARSVNLSRVTFVCENDPEAGYQYGLQTESAKIGQLTIEDCVFQSSVPALYLYGEKDKTNPAEILKEAERYVDVYSTDIGDLTIRNTPINKGRFEYMKIGTLLLENLKIVNANFSHCKIQKLEMRNVEISGTVEYADTVIHSRVSERVRDSSTGTPPTIID